MKITNKQLARFAADQISAGAQAKVVADKIAALLVAERRSRDVGTFGRLLESELAARGTDQVVITSVHGVDTVIKERLAALLGAKNALFYEVIDPHVLGGVHASTQSAQIDLTVAGQLKAFKQSVNKGTN